MKIYNEELVSEEEYYQRYFESLENMKKMDPNFRPGDLQLTWISGNIPVFYVPQHKIHRGEY